MKKWVQRVLAEKGWLLERATKEEDLLELIRSLKPMNIGYPLIRIGSHNDGGYLVPDDMQGITTCYSPGVGPSSTFEKALADRGVKIYMADYSVDRPAEEHELFHFEKKYIGSYPMENFLTMDNWMALTQKRDNEDSLLQMDIEGFEYETIFNISEEALQKFRTIIIEFHHLEYLRNRGFFRIIKNAFNKVLNSHICVHIHPNNCQPIFSVSGIRIPSAMEITFHRKDRVKTLSDHKEFPHPLDEDCSEVMAPLVLPSEWYS